MGADIQGELGFALQRDVVADSERKGLKRAQMRSKDYSEASEFIDYHRCDLRDCSTANYPIDFFKMGFDTINLSQNPDLQALLTKVKRYGFLETGDVYSLRSCLKARTFELSNGKRLRIVYVAGEGLIVRNSGPNGMAIAHDELTPKNSRQAAATLIHGDQDVYGAPLKRLLKGFAPWLFRHDTPDGKNRFSPLNLVNLWIPLQQICMPLCLMDRSTLNKKEHQLRMEITVKDVLDRNESENRNDIWTFLHDNKQEWYFRSEMGIDKAYVFDTLGMAHGAAVLLGEKAAENYIRCLQACRDAVNDKDVAKLTELANGYKQQLPDTMTRPLALALERMERLLQRAASQPQHVLEDTQAWLDESRLVTDSLIRKSIELRAVALVY